MNETIERILADIERPAVEFTPPFMRSLLADILWLDVWSERFERRAERWESHIIVMSIPRKARRRVFSVVDDMMGLATVRGGYDEEQSLRNAIQAVLNPCRGSVGAEPLVVRQIGRLMDLFMERLRHWELLVEYDSFMALWATWRREGHT